MSVIDLPKLLTDRQAAELLGIRPQTLAVWRCTRRHNLPFIRVGRSVRYRLADIEAWLSNRTVGGTSPQDR